MSLALTSKTARQNEGPVIGKGYFAAHDYRAWERVRQCLPKEIREHPHAAFPIPALCDHLSRFLQSKGYSKTAPMPLAMYEKFACSPIDKKEVAKISRKVCSLLGDSFISQDHAYHGRFHSCKEVPKRFQELFRALLPEVRDRLKKHYTNSLLSTFAHDLGHTGNGIAQQIFPQRNLSNEERAVLLFADIAKDTLHPLHILEISFDILGTSFGQSAAALGVCSEVVTLPTLREGREIQSAIPKTDALRHYGFEHDKDPDAAIMQRLLCLSDVLVSIAVGRKGKILHDNDKIFDRYLERTQDLFVEVCATKGCVFQNSSEMLGAMKGFLQGYLIPLFDSTTALDIFEKEFVTQHRDILKMLEQRVCSASEPHSMKEKQDAQRIENMFRFLKVQDGRLVLPQHDYPLPGDIIEIGGA